MNKILFWTFAVVVGGAFLWYGFTYEHNVPGTLRTVAYESSELGLSFEYPSRYDVTVRKEGNAEREWYTLTLLPSNYVPPEGGEGPPAITISAFDNREHLSLDQWIRSDERSNFKLSSQTVFEETSMHNEPALKYKYSGLYETEVIGVSHKGRVYLFSVGWMTPQDEIRSEFQDFFTSVKFTK